jgi:DNA-binding transcriptional ArsR family regulator
MDTAVNTINDFVKSLDAELRIFDMGRRLYRLSNNQFQKFENLEIPYPTPLQRHAWLGIVIWWKETKEEPLIWFLKLPLDEQGMIIPASRDDFIQRLMKAIQNRVNNPEAREQNILSESELAFTPNQERMACFHAKTSRFLGKSASSFYEPAISYLKQEQAADQWESLGLQGLADVCARLEDLNHASILESAFKWLPNPPKYQILALLENEELTTNLSLEVLEQLEKTLSSDTPDQALIAAGLRALSGSKAKLARQELIRKVLATPALETDLEILSTIVSRCWEDLENPDLCYELFERVAAQDAGEQIFVAFFLDLVAIPGVRPWLMNMVRRTDRSDALSQCIGQLFGTIQKH